jgi:PHP domain
VTPSAPPLLAELHAHTRWSDGALSVVDLVDLYGEAGFDVLCVTDHATRSDDPCLLGNVTAANFDAYLAELDREATRAWGQYGLVVLPGLELTANDADADRAAHALAVGLRRFVSVDDGIDDALLAARSAGAALVAAHPSGPESLDHRATRAWWRRYAELRGLVDRWELINRHTIYPWIAAERLPVIASGDFHRGEHLATWKTLIACEPDPDAVVAFLRSPVRCSLTVFERSAAAVSWAA